MDRIRASGLDYAVTFIGAVMAEFPTREFYKNQVIFKEGSEGNMAYILTSGCVELSVTVNNQNLVIATLNPVTVFGDMALILRDHRRTATATALGYSEVVEINKSSFEGCLKNSPQIITTILNAIAGRLQQTTAKSLKVPDIFIGTVEILNMFRTHDKQELINDHTINTIARILVTEAPRIRKIIDLLAGANLIQLKDNGQEQHIIYLPEEKNFMEKAMRLYENFREFQLNQNL
ncbi:MAG: cyclic nucleotide-binding domain-containing protein [Deltaproteobacteria bacterium]|nr:cyclic nucleotide-binding domain-containing protein [Deltaproteobacteria bacterium]